MSKDYLLKDCSPIDIKQFSKKYFRGKRPKAKEWLANLSKKSIGDSPLFQFSDSNFDDEPIVSTDRFGQWRTGRYIGSLHFEGVTIEIQPRFGMGFVANNIPLNNFIPVDANVAFESGEKFIHLLQAMLWLNFLTKAARHSLPAVRFAKKRISSLARGRIDIRGTIKSQIKDKSKIVSISSYKDINNPVTTVLVMAFREIRRWFPEQDLFRLLPQAIELRLQQMIDAIPKHATVPKPKEIRKARLGSIAKSYTPLTRLSLDILKGRGLSETDSDTERPTLLLDVAELWEIYILDVLREAAPEQIEVSHGTLEGNKYLLTDESGKGMGKLLPDYIFKAHGEDVSIGDAKYKRLGDAPWMSPKRDDLYQMTAYLSQYPECNANLYYPEFEESDPSIANKNPWRLKSNQQINFLLIPTDRDEAVAALKEMPAQWFRA